MKPCPFQDLGHNDTFNTHRCFPHPSVSQDSNQKAPKNTELLWVWAGLFWYVWIMTVPGGLEWLQSVGTTCQKQYQSCQLVWKNQGDKSDVRGEFHRVHTQEQYCQNLSKLTATFQECFVLPVCKVRQKGGKKKAAQKQWKTEKISHHEMKELMLSHTVGFPCYSPSFTPTSLCSVFCLFIPPDPLADSR